MDIGRTRSDRLIQTAMNGLAMRQRAISDNVANVDTPGFKASEVSFEVTLRAALHGGAGGARGGTFKLAHVQNELPRAQADPEFGAPEVTRLDQTTLREDGNNVDIDQQMVALAEANITYNALTQLTGSRMQLLRTIINDGRR